MSRVIHDGIDGLKGREPVGAVLTVGTRDLERKGVPINTDRFYVKVRHEERKGEIGYRPEHPDFAAYNSAKPELRRSIKGNLVHAERLECYAHSYKAAKAPKGSKWPNHPNGIPFCQGNGKVATRLYAIGKPAEGIQDDFREIPCPAELCEFRQGDVKVCNTNTRIYFQPQWAPGSTLPQPLMMYETNGYHTSTYILGFFEYVAKVVAQIGLEAYSLFGLPFTLSLNRMTKPSRQRSFPVVTMTPTFSPVTFFMAQRQSLELAGGSAPRLLVGARDPEENTDEAIAASARALSGDPSVIPAEVVGEDDLFGGALGERGEILGQARFGSSGESELEIEIKPGEFADLRDANPLHVRRLLSVCASLKLSPEQARSILGGPIDATMPASGETEAMRKLRDYKQA